MASEKTPTEARQAAAAQPIERRPLIDPATVAGLQPTEGEQAAQAAHSAREQAEREAIANGGPTEAERMAMQQAERAAAVPPADQTETPEGMVRMHVVKPFTLTRDVDGTAETFTPTGTNCGLPGYYDMQPHDAEHWYTQWHCENPPPLPEPMPGTAAAVAIEQQRNAERVLVETALDQQEAEATTQLRRNRQQRLKKALGESFEQAP